MLRRKYGKNLYKIMYGPQEIEPATTSVVDWWEIALTKYQTL